MDKVIDDLQDLILQNLAGESGIPELRDRISESLGEAFSGTSLSEVSLEETSKIYRDNPEIILVRLLENDWGVPAYITLYAFLEEKLNQIIFDTREENPSDTERKKIREMNIYRKAILLRTDDIITKKN